MVNEFTESMSTHKKPDRWWVQYTTEGLLGGQMTWTYECTQEPMPIPDGMLLFFAGTKRRIVPYSLLRGTGVEYWTDDEQPMYSYALDGTKKYMKRNDRHVCEKRKGQWLRDSNTPPGECNCKIMYTVVVEAPKP